MQYRRLKMNQRNLFLDFLKGVAIICVIFIHNLPDAVLSETKSFFHIGQAVPIFMVTSGYLGYAKYSKSTKIDTVDQFSKLIKRVLIPFWIVLGIQIIFKLGMNNLNLKSLFEKGGIGPGSYYPYVFIQCSLVLPVIIAIVNRCKKTIVSVSIMIIISALLNAVLTWFDVSEPMYRLLAVRYIFYIYLGCMWKKEGVKSKSILFALTLISAIFVYLQRYEHLNFEPFIYNDWRGYNYLGAFYTLGVIYMLNQFYELPIANKFKSALVLIGSYSYEIFLTQMFIFSFIKIRMFTEIDSMLWRQIIYISLTFFFSIVPIMVWHHIQQVDMKSYILKNIKGVDSL